MSDTPTPRTDETEKIADKMGSPAAAYGFTLARLKETELELTAAREELKRTDFALSQASIIYDVVVEQRDDFRKEVEIVNERLRGKRHPDDNGLMVDGEIDIKHLIEQRDRLAEALNRILPFVDPIIGNVRYTEAQQALQSLNPKPE